MGNVFQNVSLFLVNTLFQLYILVVVLRILLAATKADFYNPLSQAIVTVTNPPLTFLRRLVPSIGRVDTAALVLLLALKLIQLWLVATLGSVSLSFPAMLVLAVVQLLELLIYVYIFSIIIQVVVSWIAPGTYNPVVSILHSLNDPLLRPVRRIVPTMGMIDLSPLVVIVGLNVALIILRSV